MVIAFVCKVIFYRVNPKHHLHIRCTVFKCLTLICIEKKQREKYLLILLDLLLFYLYFVLVFIMFPIFIQYIAIIFAYFCVFCRKTYVLPLPSPKAELGLTQCDHILHSNSNSCLKIVKLFAENGLEINLNFFANVLRVLNSLITPYMCIVNSISKGQ